MNFVEELRWRGLLHDIMPGTEELLSQEKVTGYVGFDPTSSSLHIGSLVPVMLLMHLQRAGHKPVIMVGGATGMVGDPSGKSEERNLLSEEQLELNVKGISTQLNKFLAFNSENAAILVNNYDWYKDMKVLNFLREIGKHITVSYMMAKDSVQKRLESGLSFTEFSYQLIQGYDFYYLNKNHGCKLQMGGSDQWGNIVTGSELIRRMSGAEAYGLTAPLVTKADGGKFGKTEQGNIWLDAERTSPYQFYQFWLNTSDEDAKKYIRIFTLYNKEEIESFEKEHSEAPHLRILQKALAKEVTIRIHSEQDYETAIEASEILFGRGTIDNLRKFSEEEFLDIFDGVPVSEISFNDLENGINILEFLSDNTQIFSSRGEARKMIKAGGVSINKEKWNDENSNISHKNLINNKYILAQKGKKNYFLIKVS
ncbi:MAG: tyrosine--tRNA ligase [Bacteroidia bacterium]